MPRTAPIEVTDDDDDPNLQMLKAISDKRNKLLREMYHMIRIRKNVGAVLRLHEEEEDELGEFLDRYDISKHQENGSIQSLPENDLFLPPSPAVSPRPLSNPEEDESDDELDLIGTPARSTRHSPSGPFVDTTTIARSRSEPRASTMNVEVRDSPKSVPLQRSEPPPEPASRVSEDPDGDYEPEDEEVAVEEMVVDSRSDAPSPEPVEAAEGDQSSEPVATEHSPHADGEEQMEVDTEMPPVEQAREPASAAVFDAEPAIQETSIEEVLDEHAMDIDQEIDPDAQANEDMDAEPPVDNDELVVAVPAPTDAPPTVPIPIFRPPTPRTKPILISAPVETLRRYSEFNIQPEPPEPPPATIEPMRTLFNPQYTLPPLRSLPVEFNRKSRPSKIKRKKEKELQKEQKVDGDKKPKEKELQKEQKADGDKKPKDKEKDKEKDDFVPLGAARWNAVVKVNPVYRRLPKAMKCLSTKDWTIGMNELKLIRTVERIEFLKDGRWSFRQPKKQRGLGQTTKTHWDYLLEEMKWMRTDFREERKWKLALAYNLSTAVLEWHAAASWEERIAEGICVKWRRPADNENMAISDQSPAVGNSGDVDMETVDDIQKTSMSLGDYGASDDEDDDEQDKGSVIDPLDAAGLLADHLQANAIQDEKDVEPKTEEVDDSSVLRATTAMDIVGPDSNNIKSHPIDLATTSGVPIPIIKSGSQSSAGDSAPGLSKSKSSKIALYAPVRDRIVYSDVDKLFLDFEDFMVPHDENGSADKSPNHLPVADLTSIFPDLQPFALYEPSSTLPLDSKRKSEKKLLDDWKTRIDETERTKICPVGKYMHTKPTLIGALQPALHWRNGEWTNLELVAISEDPNVPAKIPDDCCNDLFDSKTHTVQPVFKEPRKPSTHLWTSTEDALLKSFVERFNGNWSLITELFNGHNQSLPTDKRSVRECFDRWKEWDNKARGPDTSNGAEDTPPPTSAPPATPNQVMTRGVKRLASVSVSSPTAGSSAASSGESRKRRRHVVVQDAIRRAHKKKAELQQKTNAGRKPSVVHETHGALQKMAKYSPGQISQMKQDKENQERQARNAAAAQAHAAHAQAQALAAQAHQLAQQQQQQQQQTQNQVQQSPPHQSNQPNGRSAGSPTNAAQPVPLPAQPTPVVARPIGTAVQGVPQIRNQQVNISQQQRVPAPLISATPRLAAAAHQTQQILQARAAHQLQGQALSQQALSQMIAAHAVQVAAQGQAPNVAQTSPPVVNGNASAHLSPPSYVSRDATSSPLAHTSPPRSTATPSNPMSSPRPPSAQAHHTPQMASASLQAVQQAVQAQLQGNGMARAIPGHYYIPNSGYPTQEHLLRMQAMLLQQANSQQQPPNAPFTG